MSKEQMTGEGLATKEMAVFFGSKVGLWHIILGFIAGFLFLSRCDEREEVFHLSGLL